MLCSCHACIELAENDKVCKPLGSLALQALQSCSVSPGKLMRASSLHALAMTTSRG